jgi:hypothetical protein
MMKYTGIEKITFEKAVAEAESRFDTAHKMADVIPFGQPIMVGHHSEKSDRLFRARIDSHHRKGVEAYQRARDLKSGLQGSEKLLAKQEDPGAVARKVNKFETELRRLKLHEHWYQNRNEFKQKVAVLL